MKKKFAILLTAAVLLSACLTGCGGGYAAKYSAEGLKYTNNTSDLATMSFEQFDGTKVFGLNAKKDSEGMITYSASLESGSITVYYDSDGTKTEMFTINGGEEVSSTCGPFGDGRVYVIVETNEASANGSFEFEIE